MGSRGRAVLPFLLLIALPLVAGADPAEFGRDREGALRPGCSYVADAPPLTARIDFVGGIQFAEGDGGIRPKDPAAAVRSLRVSELRLGGDDRIFDFVGASEEPDGFLLRWRSAAVPPETVAVYTRWASLKDASLRPKNVVCREGGGG
ncbi:MAG TPA: hypothetical protein VMW35_06400 [Myxococcota bacterium]|jgi:hypothetical protein|nr:hypothetical protein [Myxococcota bacterium]